MMNTKCSPFLSFFRVSGSQACKSTKWLPSESCYVHFKQDVVDTELSLSPDWKQLFEYLHQQTDMYDPHPLYKHREPP